MYQSSKGGKQYVPLEKHQGLIGSNTPLFAKTLSWKYAHLSSQKVAEDMKENHFRKISRSHIQSLSYLVGEKFLACETEISYRHVSYRHGVRQSAVKAISIGRDGAMLRLRGGHYREAMVGTLSLLGAQREVLHTIYLGDQPEYGKEGFDIMMSNEILALKKQFPDIAWSAVADGAAHNWAFLSPYAETQIIDWWHAWEYIRAGLAAIYPSTRLEKQVEKWQEKLKKEENSVLILLKLLKRYAQKFKKEQKCTQVLQKSITYIANHLHQMNYASYLEQGFLIGSGVTESACKSMVKSRFCACGMAWQPHNTRLLLLNRGLALTPNRWAQAWAFISNAAA